MPFLGLQTSFTAGELAPSLTVRVDLARFQTGCKTLENMFVHPHGGASKRNGFRYLDTLESNARLMPFVFSKTDAYILVWTDKKLFFYSRDGAILNEDNSIYFIETPYTIEEAKEVGFVQSADVIYLASRSHAPYKLSRYGHTDWRLEIISFLPKAPCPLNLSGYLYDVRTDGEIEGDGSGRRNWYFVVTQVDQNGEESLPCDSISVNGPENLRTTCYPKLSWTTNTSNDSIATEFRIYQEKNGKYGYIGSSLSNEFDAKNIAPDMTDCPPEEVNPFVDENYPGTVCFFQQRLIFAGSDQNPQTLWFSRTGNYESFSRSSPSKADDSMEVTIAGNEISHVEWLVALRTLLVGSSGTEWEVKSSGTALSASDISVVPQSYRGSSNLPALVVGNSVLHMSRTNKEMRDLLYDFGTDSYTGSDHAVLASHLFEQEYITDWTYQQSPHSIIWCVRSDGVLLGHTHLREHEVFAWHRHNTKGKFQSIASLPSENEDELFAVIAREINGETKYFLERLESTFNVQNVASDQTDNPNKYVFYADAALSYQGEATTKIVGLDHLLGEEVCIVADGAVSPNQIVRVLDEYILEEESAEEDSSDDTISDDTINDSTEETSSEENISENNTEESIENSSDTNSTQTIIQNIGVEIPFAASTIVIGLPYTARLQSMPLEPELGSNSIGKKKYINRIGVYFKDTNSAWIGTDFDNASCMDEVKWRLSEVPGEAINLHTEDAWIYTNATYDSNVHACVESNDPLPCTVLAIMPEVAVSSM